jgi:predicted Zn-dependent protease
VSGLVPLNATLAEHWLYLPSAFLLLAAALRFPARTLTISFAALWIAFLGARTFVRTFDWKDQRTFVERTIATGGDSARMLINLGGLEMSEGRLEEARVHLDAALRKDPDQPLAVINAAALVVKQNDFTRARELLARATQMPLVEAQAHELLAVLEFRETGHANLLRMRLASRSGAPNWAIEKRYVQILDETGATDGAIAELQRCVETQWYRADSWRLLSQLLTKRGDAEGAREAEEQAHRYDVRL